MSLLNKFKTNSYCVGGRHHSGTNNIRGVSGNPLHGSQSKELRC